MMKEMILITNFLLVFIFALEFFQFFKLEINKYVPSKAMDIEINFGKKSGPYMSPVEKVLEYRNTRIENNINISDKHISLDSIFM